MPGSQTQSAEKFLGGQLPEPAGMFASMLNRNADRLRLQVAIAQRVRLMWPDAQAAMLWDGDVCYFCSRGAVLTDICADTGSRKDAEHKTVRIIPRESISKVDWTERVDPTRTLEEVDAAARARASGFVAGLGSHFFAGGSTTVGMVGAYLINRAASAHRGEALTWQRVEIVTRDAGTLGMDLCHDRAAAALIANTLSGR
jgi:hypothetical protein